MPINKDSRHCVRVTVTTRLWFRRLRHPRTLVETVSLPHASSALSLAKPEWQIHACILLLSKTSTRYCACIVSTFWKPEWQIHACILRLSKTSTRYCACTASHFWKPEWQIYASTLLLSKTSTHYRACIVSSFSQSRNGRSILLIWSCEAKLVHVTRPTLPAILWKSEWQIYVINLLRCSCDA